MCFNHCFIVFLVLFLLTASTWDVSDKKKRWMVIGIALNHVLLPALRDFVGTEMSAFYMTQKTNKGIDHQVRGTHWNKDKGFTLNYGSINNNFGSHKKKSHFYDYRVLSAVDLGKLYLEPHMAKFTGEYNRDMRFFDFLNNVMHKQGRDQV